MTKLYLEDIQIGQIHETGETTLGRDEMIEFSKQYDPQPMHLTDEGGADSFFGQFVGSGWHLLTTTMRLVVDSKPLGGTPLIGVFVEDVHLSAPLFPGVTIKATSEVLDVKPESSQEGFGYAKVLITSFADGKPIAKQKWTLLVPKKPV